MSLGDCPRCWEHNCDCGWADELLAECIAAVSNPPPFTFLKEPLSWTHEEIVRALPLGEHEGENL